MLTRCLVLSLDEILADDPDATQVDCILENPKILEQQEEYLFKQLLSERTTAYGHHESRELVERQTIAGLTPRKPTGAEIDLVNLNKELANANEPEALLDFLTNAATNSIPCIRKKEMQPFVIPRV
jgi:hypothetical protein